VLLVLAQEITGKGLQSCLHRSMASLKTGFHNYLMCMRVWWCPIII